MMSEGGIPKGMSCSSSSYEDRTELRRGPWTLEEDNLLIQYISCHGEGRWNSLAKCAGLKRTGKSCRLRWLNYLKPDIKRGNLTPHEQLLILELHSKWGNRWSKIAQHLPGRTDNEIKNYWRTRVQKQARQLKVDSNSKKFLEAIRMFWMPRLIEKMEQNSSSLTSSPSSSSMDTQKFTVPSAHVLGPVPMPQPCPKPNQMVQNNRNNNNSSLFNINNPENSGIFAAPAAVQTNAKLLCEKPTQEDCYYVGNVPSYDMQEFGASQDVSFLDCHVGGSDWFGDDFGGGFWNCTDELWQFKEVGVYSR